MRLVKFFMSYGFQINVNFSFIWFQADKVKVWVPTHSDAGNGGWPRYKDRSTRKGTSSQGLANANKGEHVVSLRAFGNYLRPFIPNFMEIDQHLKNITKKGMTFEV